MQSAGGNSIAVYVRISRDDNGENYETIENQRGMLLDYAQKHCLGRVFAVFIDDNVSGSAFDRRGLASLKEEVLRGNVNMLLIKDLSRLGRNNAKTLQWIDFLEEYGIRILTADGRYDSMIDNDTVGIETWANERYVRDISRKIRSSLRFKIQSGEYLGNAPFGYKKSASEKNRLVRDEEQSGIVRLIYGLYRSGLGYTSIAKLLDERCMPSPEGTGWNRISVRRILTSRVYIGDTVQGISEKISFKSKKTRRLPREDWVITEGTHEEIISKEEFLEVQRIRENKAAGKSPHTGAAHVLNGIIRCGRCGSTMYARKRTGGTAYICGNYCRGGRTACSSHFVYEDRILKHICDELSALFKRNDCSAKMAEMLRNYVGGGAYGAGGAEKIRKQLEASRRQQELLYRDRLEGRITVQLFDRMNIQLENRLRTLEKEVKRFESAAGKDIDAAGLIRRTSELFAGGYISNEIARLAVSGIAVFDREDNMECGGDAGTIVIDLRF